MIDSERGWPPNGRCRQGPTASHTGRANELDQASRVLAKKAITSRQVDHCRVDPVLRRFQSVVRFSDVRHRDPETDRRRRGGVGAK